MRSGPVNLPAAGATAELLVINFGKRLEFIDDIRLWLRLPTEHYSEDTA